MDSAQSKVMVERVYQGPPKTIEQIEPYHNDPARFRSAIYLGKYALMEYVQAGKGYSAVDISRCGNLSTLVRPK